ncbi:phosphoglycerate mutase [Biomphalaria glabrata]|nr:putative phosphoglycerate mutase [Biomphalaria glabrata]
MRNMFCGRHDAELSQTGIQEAVYRGQLLTKEGYELDVAFTSVLKRAIKTQYLIQEELDRHWLPVINVSDNDVTGLNLPTAISLVYELDENQRPVKHHYLATEEEVKAAQAKVAAQGKAK